MSNSCYCGDHEHIFAYIRCASTLHYIDHAYICIHYVCIHPPLHWSCIYLHTLGVHPASITLIMHIFAYIIGVHPPSVHQASRWWTRLCDRTWPGIFCCGQGDMGKIYMCSQPHACGVAQSMRYVQQLLANKPSYVISITRSVETRVN